MYKPRSACHYAPIGYDKKRKEFICLRCGKKDNGKGNKKLA